MSSAEGEQIMTGIKNLSPTICEMLAGIVFLLALVLLLILAGMVTS